MKKILLAILTIATVGIHAQTLDWAKRNGGTDNDISASIAADDLGNVYAIGHFRGTADFDPGAGISNLISAGNTDVFIQKLDSAGDLVWAKRIGGTGNEYGNSIAVDDSGNVYTTGFFNGTVDFDPNAGTNNLISNGGNDIYILKLDQSGNFVWANSFGGNSVDVGNSITTDHSGNIYVIGHFTDKVDFDPDTSQSVLTAIGSSDIFIQKMNKAGVLIWAKSMGGTDADRGLSIDVDSSGNVFTTGIYYKTVDFDPGTGIHNITSAGQTDIFVQKLDSAGNFVWAKSMGGTFYDAGNSIAIAQSGNIYTTGYFALTADFDPDTGTTNLISNGNYDVFIQKLDTAGKLVWAKNMGGTSTDQGRSIALDELENIYTIGAFNGTADFDPDTGTTNLTSNGFYDIFIQKLDADGKLVWTEGIGGTASDQGTSITVDAVGNVYTIGEFRNTVDFDPDTGITNLTSAGHNDIFIQKLKRPSTIVTNINEISNPIVQLSVYPNPTKGKLIIANNQGLIINLSIIDMNGRVVKLIAPTSNEIDVADLTTGLYFLRGQSKTGIVSAKFIKE